MNARQMWEEYSLREGIEAAYEAWQYGDDADLLARLTLSGKKTATASAYPLYELEGCPLPRVGEYSVILDSREEAVCIIRTERVFVIPFSQVDDVHARKEGEGDLSLSWWRRVHEDFFSREMEEAGLEFDWQMNVVCEEFIRVFP